MKCPTCDVRLRKAVYANANVDQCSQCFGLLLSSYRGKAIKQRIDKDIDQLIEEARNAPQHDTLGKIRCPKCRTQMSKAADKEFGFMIDECERCELTWFDPRELAILQLAYESSPQRVEMNAFRERLKNMTPAERAEYEKRISELKDLGGPLQQALSEAGSELWFRYLQDDHYYRD
ncbi:MAG: zf-TFIIB domain-containing protein [Planctomycetota bacterium]